MHRWISRSVWLAFLGCSGGSGEAAGEKDDATRANEMDLSSLSVERTEDGLVVSSDSSGTREIKCAAASCDSMCSVCFEDICEQLGIGTCAERAMGCKNACFSYSCDAFDRGGVSPCDDPPACDPRDPLCRAEGTRLDQIMREFFAPAPEAATSPGDGVGTSLPPPTQPLPTQPLPTRPSPTSTPSTNTRPAPNY